jgi:CdiI immunity protein
MFVQQYPYLSELLGGYFHQDALDDGESDEDIIRDFIATSHPYQRLGVRADVQRFLHQHRGELLKATAKAFAPAVTLGESEAELEAWLQKLERMLRE